MVSLIVMWLSLSGLQAVDLFPKLGPFSLVHEQRRTDGASSVTLECVFFGKDLFVSVEAHSDTVLELQSVLCPNKTFWRKASTPRFILGVTCVTADLGMLEEHLSMICYSASLEEVDLLNSAFKFDAENRLMGSDGTLGGSVLDLLGFAMSHAMQGAHVDTLRPGSQTNTTDEVWLLGLIGFNEATAAHIVRCVHNRQLRVEYTGRNTTNGYVVSAVGLFNETSVRLQVLPSVVTPVNVSPAVICRELSEQFHISAELMSGGLTDALATVIVHPGSPTSSGHCELQSRMTEDRVMVPIDTGMLGSHAAVLCQGVPLRFLPLKERNVGGCDELRKTLSLYQLCSGTVEVVGDVDEGVKSLGNVLRRILT